MTCSNTASLVRINKIRTRVNSRVARLSGLQMRREERAFLQRGRAKRIGKAQRILNEVKALYKNVRTAAGLTSPGSLKKRSPLSKPRSVRRKRVADLLSACDRQ